MRNSGLDETQAWIKISWRNTSNLRCADDSTLMAESEEELKSLLMKAKEESEKTGLKLNNLFNGWVILHCVYVPQLSYSFVCWWTSRFFPCPGYYKQCCNEHWGTCVSFNSCFLSVYAQKWDCWVIRQFYLQFFKESPHCSPYWLY